MIKVQLSKDNILRVHYKAPQRIITKAVTLANEFINGNLLPRKLSNGKLRVIDVDTNNRIVIENTGKINLYEHQQYNKKIKLISR